jgi:hypothetical protein
MLAQHYLFSFFGPGNKPPSLTQHGFQKLFRFRRLRYYDQGKDVKFFFRLFLGRILLPSQLKHRRHKDLGWAGSCVHAKRKIILPVIAKPLLFELSHPVLATFCAPKTDSDAVDSPPVPPATRFKQLSKACDIPS